MSFAPMTVIYDGLRLDLTPGDLAQSWQVYWNYPDENEVGGHPPHFSKTRLLKEDATYRVVVDNKKDPNDPDYLRWRTDVPVFAPMKYAGGEDYAFAPPFNVVNQLPVSLILNVEGTDNYDWNGNRPDHAYPEGLQGYRLPSIYTEDDMERRNAFPVIFPFVNPHSRGTPFNLVASVEHGERITVDRFNRKFEQVEHGGGQDKYSTAWWAAVPQMDKKNNQVVNTRFQLGDFDYTFAGKIRTGHRVMFYQQYDVPGPYRNRVLVTTTTMLFIDGTTPGPF